MPTVAIALTEYQGFQQAYDFFNRELFSGTLPQVLVTLRGTRRPTGTSLRNGLSVPGMFLRSEGVSPWSGRQGCKSHEVKVLCRQLPGSDG